MRYYCLQVPMINLFVNLVRCKLFRTQELKISLIAACSEEYKTVIPQYTRTISKLLPASSTSPLTWVITKILYSYWDTNDRCLQNRLFLLKLCIMAAQN